MNYSPDIEPPSPPTAKNEEIIVEKPPNSIATQNQTGNNYIINQGPTAEELARVVKKEINPQIKNNAITKYPPDVSKAKSRIDIDSVDKFDINYRYGLKKDVNTAEPASFELATKPDPKKNDSRITVKTQKSFGSHMYVSVKLAAVENVQTMDLIGDNVCICIDPTWNKYFIWESQTSQVVWQDINIAKPGIINTLGIYQKGRDVFIYINNSFITSFKKISSPVSGKVGIQLKADHRGGRMHFDNLTVWEF